MFKRRLLVISAFFVLIFLTVSCSKTTTDSTAVLTTFNPTTPLDLYPDEVTYPSGTFNFRFEDAELRQTFLAAAEEYLLKTMYGGVPLFSRSDFVVYSDRVNLPIDENLPAIEYLDEYGRLSADDSNVLMANGSFGNEDDFTFRKTSERPLSNYNQYLSDFLLDEEYYELFLDLPFKRFLNGEGNGYDFLGSMLMNEPKGIELEYNDFDLEVAYKWQFDVKEGLEWFYHPNTDLNAVTDNDITASDFVETYKTVLKNNWYPGPYGAGWLTSSYEIIKGTEEYVNEPTEENWDNVGIKLIDTYTFELEFSNQQSLSTVIEFMSNYLMSPIHVEMFELLGEDFASSYSTIAYHGPYYIDSVDESNNMTLKRNPNFHDYDKYNYTGYQISVIPDYEDRVVSFNDGYLDVLYIDIGSIDQFENHQGLREIEGLTTFRMMINGLGSSENQQNYFVNSTYEPEPILANIDFRKAMYFALDRSLLKEIDLTYKPNMYHFSNRYLIDSLFGVPYRKTDFGISVGEDLFSETGGYNSVYSKELFNSAIKTLVENGVYERGDTIVLDLFVFDIEEQELLGYLIKSSFEEVFVSEEYNINVEINVESKSSLEIYYYHTFIGEFDLAIGGVSGSEFNAASYLEMFCDDNRSGFTMNYGIDTSTANIEVKYKTYVYHEDSYAVDVTFHREMWSFNAIVSALNGITEVIDGEEFVE